MAADHILKLFNTEVKRSSNIMKQTELEIRKKVSAYCKLMTKSSEDLEPNFKLGNRSFISTILTDKSSNNLEVKWRINIGIFFSPISSSSEHVNNAMNFLELAFPEAQIGKVGRDIYVVYNSAEVY